jgi:hypothetical protein
LVIDHQLKRAIVHVRFCTNKSVVVTVSESLVIVAAPDNKSNLLRVVFSTVVGMFIPGRISDLPHLVDAWTVVLPELDECHLNSDANSLFQSSSIRHRSRLELTAMLIRHSVVLGDRRPADKPNNELEYLDESRGLVPLGEFPPSTLQFAV